MNRPHPCTGRDCDLCPTWTFVVQIKGVPYLYKFLWEEDRYRIREDIREQLGRHRISEEQIDELEQNVKKRIAEVVK